MNYDRHTGSRYAYDYVQLPREAPEKQVAVYCADARQRFAAAAKSFNDTENSHWMLRHYLALKYVINASVMIGASIYSAEKNVGMSVPYLNYYSLLNVCRAFLWTAADGLPTGAENQTLSHDRILNTTANLMRRLDTKAEARWGNQLRRAHHHRNLFSYRFPSSGLGFLGAAAQTPQEIGNLARLIAELAMLNTECLDSALERHSKAEFIPVNLPAQDWASIYDLDDKNTKDHLDREWLNKTFSRRVSTLSAIAADGLIEDLYGAWAPEDDTRGDYNPDDYMYYLLRV